MRKQVPSQEVDPLALPLGTKVGPWRVTGFRGRGSYGTLYRAELVGREEGGSAALKLAVHPGDERFKREAWLLRHIHSLYVPGFLGDGEWEHPTGMYPYVVMELVEGEPLYDWAVRRNPSEREVLRLLAQVAQAVADTHATGGVHRDVKGSNVLIRRGDGRAFLTDFGAGGYRGASTLTSKVLPPGTPGYRSPEAWGFLQLFRRHPTAHYPASACDDLFALGMTAYRLVTDEYPPLADPEATGSEVWREGGHGPRAPSELNPRVSPELDALILRLLARAPEERFGGKALEAVEALERARRDAGAWADSPLFGWDTSPAPRWRSPKRVHLAEQQDTAARQEVAQRAVEEPPRVATSRKQAIRRVRNPLWGEEMAMAIVGLLLAVLTTVALYRGPVGKTASRADRGDIVAVGDSASVMAVSELAPMRTDRTPPAVGLPMPDKPFEGQRTPPCNRNGEVALRGGCWYELARATLPCREDAYEWNGACYLPSYPARRQSTSQPP